MSRWTFDAQALAGWQHFALHHWLVSELLRQLSHVLPPQNSICLI
jgi:hypothetical protein